MKIDPEVPLVILAIFLLVVWVGTWIRLSESEIEARNSMNSIIRTECEEIDKYKKNNKVYQAFKCADESRWTLAVAE